MIISAIATLLLAPGYADVYGNSVIPIGDPTKVATILIFVVDGCPIARKYTPEINRVAATFAPKKVATYLVFSEPDIKPAPVRAMTKDFGLKPRALISRSLAVAAKVKNVPTAVLYDRAGKIQYHGRIDDRFPSLGIQRKPQRRDLSAAVTEFLAGSPITVPATTVIGCVMPGK